MIWFKEIQTLGLQFMVEKDFEACLLVICTYESGGYWEWVVGCEDIVELELNFNEIDEDFIEEIYYSAKAKLN